MSQEAPAGGLAGAVRTEEAMHFALDRQAQAVESFQAFSVSTRSNVLDCCAHTPQITLGNPCHVRWRTPRTGSPDWGS